MKGKILFLAGVATGFVLGSKAGRQTYERMRSRAKQTWEDPTVQKTVSQVGQLAQDAATVAHAKMSEAVDHATTTARGDKDAKHTASSEAPAASVDPNKSDGDDGTAPNPGGKRS